MVDATRQCTANIGSCTGCTYMIRLYVYKLALLSITTSNARVDRKRDYLYKFPVGYTFVCIMYRLPACPSVNVHAYIMSMTMAIKR